MFCILCVRVFVFVVDAVYFSFFQCSWFSVSSSVFFRCSIFFFLPFILLILLLGICLKPHSFFFFYRNQPSIHTKRYVRHVLNQLYFTSAWLLITHVTLSKTVNPLAEKPLLIIYKCGLIWAPSTRIRRKNAVSKMSQIRLDMAFTPCLQGGRGTLVLGGLP